MQEMLQNYIHLQNTEPTEMISCIVIVLLLADHRSKRMTMIEFSLDPLSTTFVLIDSCLKTAGLFYFSKSGNSKINLFENEMTLARPPMVLSTHTNDYAISQYCKRVQAQTVGEKLVCRFCDKSDFFILFQNNEN